ncbi:hypothetical protein CC86DRAFT_369779 [Ophiobolus disseminans]|uniref:Flavin reductase like domain-containing protein n=1 Tax=Ophiobolus disseminans TaxID=1469910 RepID=A0A6A7A4E9_9PLEO|nr:hypothetical protein CC86DRAFT_369779 [Ophiobolus disseminans]
MALAQRPASRFFAAFYRWSQQHTQPCAVSSAYSRSIPLSLLHARKYHATRVQRQQHQIQVQSEATEQHIIETPDEEVTSANKPPEDKDGATPHEPEHVRTDAETMRNDVRNLMRKVPSSVAVVTVASIDAALKKNVPMGVAVSSLSTVSMDPPTISFNIKHPSKTLDAIRAAKGLFRVHFPAADRGGASMVEAFCRGNHPDAYANRRKRLRIYVPGLDPHRDKLRATTSNAPQIFEPSVRAAMECTLTHEFQVGDHVILVASVDDIESTTSNIRTILYVDGVYMQPDGTQVTAHLKDAIAIKDGWSAYDYPLIPGEAQRRDYLNRLKEMVRKDPALLQGRRDVLRELDRSLPISPGAWGISLAQVADEVRQASGLISQLPAALELSSPLSDFYGRLSPSDRAKIYERAENFVKEDERFLALNFRVFLQNLGVSPSSIGLLPSDIMSALREAGLVGAYEPREGNSSSDSRNYNAEYLEQVEHRIRDHLAAVGYDVAVKTRFSDVVVSLGEQQTLSSYFIRARNRLVTEASPLLFTSPNIDISGHVSLEESRVIMRRAIEFLHNGNERRNKVIDTIEVLRRIGVHPAITGFNVEFFLGKLKHVQDSTRQSRHVPDRIGNMLRPLFSNSVTWANLEKRVKNFVRRTPARAMSWSNRDKLAAMGFVWDATLEVPLSEKKQPLNQGHILETLVAKELKNLYGKSTQELNEAIARYLKEQYNFDVNPASTQASAIDALTRSSDAEMQDAMLVSRNVDVLANKRSHLSFQGDQAAPASTSTQRGAGLRIRYRDHGSQIQTGDEGPTSKQQGANVEKAWTSYSLMGGRR